MNGIISKGVVRFARNTFKLGKRFVKLSFSEKHLLKTNLVLSSGLAVTADGFVQTASKPSDKQFDKSRMTKMGCIGLEFGLLCHYWYIFLDKKIVGTSLRAVCYKVLVDQVIMSPVFILLFFSSLAVMERSSARAALSETAAKGPKLYVLDWLIWAPAQYINFRYLPLRFRLLFDISLSFIVDVFYSFIRFEQK